MDIPDIEITVQRNEMRGTMAITAEFHQLPMIREAMSGAIFAEAGRLIAERYVAENFAEIAKHLDPQAIANLSVAEAGAEISKALKEEVATKYIETVRKVVEPQLYQRGVFGGVKRIA